METPWVQERARGLFVVVQKLTYPGERLGSLADARQRRKRGRLHWSCLSRDSECDSTRGGDKQRRQQHRQYKCNELRDGRADLHALVTVRVHGDGEFAMFELQTHRRNDDLKNDFRLHTQINVDIVETGALPTL